jgi:phosphoglycolate phosphatase
MERLVLFDIDGTLVRTQNGYVPFNEALLKTFGIAGDIRSVIPDGNTDPLIVGEIFAKAQVDIKIAIDQWEQFAANLQRSYANAIAAESVSIRALPGAVELLKALSANEDFGQAIVTGNCRASARVKLEAAGLSSYLDQGAYGCDSPNRADLPTIAKHRCEQATATSVRPERCIIIGDTPKDLHAARKNAMKCILVGTGRYPVEELLYSEPDACLPDLCDTAEVVKTLSTL